MRRENGSHFLPREKEGTEDSGDIKAAPRAEFAERPQAVLPALGSLLALSSSLTWLPVPPEGRALDSGLVLGDKVQGQRMVICRRNTPVRCHLSFCYIQATRAFALNEAD